MPAPQPLPSRLIGALFVERGLVSESQIRIALEIQNETGQQLGQILVERFGVSRKELASVVADQWAKLGGSAGPEDTASWRRLGEIFVDRGFVTQDELDQARARQRQTGERLGEALVAQGVISKFELAGALAEQMAALEASDGDATEGAAAEATVHHLPARPDEPDDTVPAAVLELIPAEDNGYGSLEASEPSVNGSGPHLDEALDHEPHEAHAVVADEAVDAGVDEADAAEPAFAELAVAEPLADELELAEAPVDDVTSFPEPVEEIGPAELPVEVVAFPDAADDAVGADPAVACVAFAPTTSGYRLVPLEAVPASGETIEVPDVGLRLVLRVGRSPHLPDDRICAFVEEPVTPAPAEPAAAL
jgi:hypothetical protein